jgi:sulfate permease
MMFFLILISALFFAMNMGGASFAASFASPYGSKILSEKRAALLFILFVIIGALTFGQNVSLTLGEDIVPQELLSLKAIALIFIASGISMYAANIINIPQSTSLVTVAAIAGVGAALDAVNIETIKFFVPFWVGLPVLSYVLTRLIAGGIYPPRKSNFWVYEKFVNQQTRLRKFVVIASCYSAFSVGTNNVANVVGPISGLERISLVGALFSFGVMYGLGAFVFRGPIKTAGDKIVPLGLLTASIIALVSGSLMLIASSFGVPQSFVMIQMGSLFAIASLKHGTEITFKDPLTLKTFYTWTINPVITFFLTWVVATNIL